MKLLLTVFIFLAPSGPWTLLFATKPPILTNPLPIPGPDPNPPPDPVPEMV